MSDFSERDKALLAKFGRPKSRWSVTRGWPSRRPSPTA